VQVAIRCHCRRPLRRSQHCLLQVLAQYIARREDAWDNGPMVFTCDQTPSPAGGQLARQEIDHGHGA
jgi:hypothetical protein